MTDTDSVLVAVSGGMDSMVLLHLLHSTGLSVAVAHCNFCLRGAESDADEQLVQDYCQQRGIPFHSKRFDTKAIADTSNSSVQMVARDLRYGYFQELMATRGYRFCALAHHADDRIESLVLNVLRGTGVRGFQGMPAARSLFIRPLLAIRKLELEMFAEQNLIPFRTDGSNAEARYMRNRVRLHLLPMLHALRKDSDVLLLHFAERAEKSMPDFERWADIQRKLIVEQRDNALSIDREKWKAHPYPFTILKEIIGPLGFSSEQVFELLREQEAQSGMMDSGSHRLFIGKKHFLILGKEDLEQVPIFKVELIKMEEVRSLQTSPNTIHIDAALVRIDSLLVRKWAEGDRFRPFGMKGAKKLSDYFIDNRFTAAQKAMAWLLVHGEDIVWVMGHRMDDRFKVTGRTEEVLRVTLVGQWMSDRG